MAGATCLADWWLHARKRVVKARRKAFDGFIAQHNLEKKSPIELTDDKKTRKYLFSLVVISNRV
jgi:hypothetical protein